MNVFGDLLYGFGIALQPWNLLACFFGVFVGTLVGVLPGIGPVKAQAIIDGRPYANPEDIMKVKGIKQGEYNKIKDTITVR